MRAVRRAGIDLWYTEGFNPHPYLAFAMPLSLGIESEGEPVDIRLEGDMSNEEVRERLNATLPRDVEITAVRDAVMKPNMIAEAEYTIELEGCFAKAVRDALSDGSLPAEKTGKAGRKKAVKTINCCDYIDALTAEDMPDGVTVINAVLACGSEKNLSPLLLIKALGEKLGIALTAKKVVRKRLMTEDLKDFE